MARGVPSGSLFPPFAAGFDDLASHVSGKIQRFGHSASLRDQALYLIRGGNKYAFGQFFDANANPEFHSASILPPQTRYPNPAFFHRKSTRRRTSGSIRMTAGQAREKPSSVHLRVASTPIFEP